MKEIMEDTVSINKRELSSLEVERTGNGLTIKCKSALIEKYMQDISNGDKKIGDGAWGKGLEYYKIPLREMDNDGSYNKMPTINNWGLDNIINNATQRSNFSFIRAVGLKDGIEIKFDGLFLKKDIELLKEDFKNFITKFYISYIKNVKFKITIVTEA